MATIVPREGKRGTSYRAVVRIKGARVRTKMFRRKTDAKIWAQNTEVAIRSGRQVDVSPAHRRTFGELVDRFISEILPTQGPGDHRVVYHLDWWVEKIGAETRLADVTPARIVEIRDRLARGESLSGKPVSPATVKRYLAILSRVFSVAIKEWFWLEHNPCSRVPRPKEPRGRVRFLDDDERERLLEASKASFDSRLYPLVVLAISTGARQNELMGLRWKDVDLSCGRAVFLKTKNDERRAVPITGPALELLKDLSTVRRIDTDRIFVNRWGRARFPREAWEQAREAARLEDFKFHDLRHTAASYLAMSGATLAEIAEILGHKTLMMVKRYAHLTEAHTRGVLERMTSKL